MSEKNKGGRPSIFTQELADLICMRTATSSFGIRKLCRTYNDLPNVDTIYEWRYKNKEFSEQYAAAKLKQAEFMAEEIIEIADDATNDWMQTQDDQGGVAWKLNGEHIQRSKLRVETRKWQAAKLLPKTYGGGKDEDENKQKSDAEKYALRQT